MIALMHRAHKWRLLPIAASGLLLAFGSMAQADPDQERKETLVALYRLLAQQEICEFAVSDAQSDALEKATGALEEALKLGEADIDKLYKETESSVKKQNAKALCDPNGEAVKAYDSAMAGLGK